MILGVKVGTAGIGVKLPDGVVVIELDESTRAVANTSELRGKKVEASGSGLMIELAFVGIGEFVGGELDDGGSGIEGCTVAIAVVVSSPHGQGHVSPLVRVVGFVLSAVVDEKPPPQGQVQGFPPPFEGVAAVEGASFLNEMKSAVVLFNSRSEVTYGLVKEIEVGGRIGLGEVEGTESDVGAKVGAGGELDSTLVGTVEVVDDDTDLEGEEVWVEVDCSTEEEGEDNCEGGGSRGVVEELEA